MLQFLWLGNPENRRCHFFLEAAQRAGLPQPKLLSYATLLTQQVDWEKLLQGVDWLRIESPGENAQVAQALLQWGADHPQLTAAVAPSFRLPKGSLIGMQQQHWGFMRALDAVAQALEAFPQIQLVNSLDYIRLCFDKQRCHARFEQQGIAVPSAVYGIKSYEELRQAMNDKGWKQVFIKPLHGSSASGVVAFRRRGQRVSAITSTDMQVENNQLQLYNSLRLSHYKTEKEIARLIDRLAQEGILVERWIPKASLEEATFDLRMVVIGGKAEHTVVRQSRSPLTNLHLGNCRGSLDNLQTFLGTARWQLLQQLAEQAAAALPPNHCASLDVLVGSNFENAYIIEANAFGDLLPRVLHRGNNTYTSVIHHLKHQYYV
jgi:glutathione synthase/RimK-type ligase-like ATP-grasp enzyme